MRQNMKFLVLTAVLSGIFTATAFSQTAPEDPTQLGSRQIEVRTLDVSYDLAYRSATRRFSVLAMRSVIPIRLPGF